MADLASIEEANQIRAAFGQKPLPVPSGASSAGPLFKESKAGSSDSEEEASTLETRQAASYDNWQRRQDEADAKAKRDVKNAAIKKARDAAQRFKKLEGKGLGEENNGEVDAKTWLIQQKKRQKKLERERARKLEEELAEREAQAEYTAADLAGVRVGHEMGDFGDGDDQVLTLKDTSILENEEDGDELENLDIRQQEKLDEKSKLKKKRPVYDPKSFDEEGQQELLGQYDEVIDGKKQRQLTLDAEGGIAGRNGELDEDSTQKFLISLDSSGEEDLIRGKETVALISAVANATSDYLDASETKMRKPKKKKKSRTTRQKIDDEDDIFPLQDNSKAAPKDGNQNGMEIDSRTPVGAGEMTAAPRKRVLEDTSFVDDDDLQASLAQQRRSALKKRKKMGPADLARQLRAEASATPQPVNGEDGDQTNGREDDGLVIDETSEFVANIQKPQIPERSRRAISKSAEPNIEQEEVEAGEAINGEDVEMNDADEVKNEEELKARLKRETSSHNVPDVSSTGLNDETTLTGGIGATLAMLSQRGLVKRNEGGEDLNALHRDRQRFLTEKQKLENEADQRARQQRERDRASGKLDRMSAREKEAYAQAENRSREQFESRRMAEIFNREYKPDVNIRYTDEYGRNMNQREAFKHLSHQFHGKGSGKLKTEKHLKKIEEEKKNMAMSSLDNSERTGMDNAMGMTARKNRQAGVRLG